LISQSKNLAALTNINLQTIAQLEQSTCTQDRGDAGGAGIHPGHKLKQYHQLGHHLPPAQRPGDEEGVHASALW